MDCDRLTEPRASDATVAAVFYASRQAEFIILTTLLVDGRQDDPGYP